MNCILNLTGEDIILYKIYLDLLKFRIGVVEYVGFFYFVFGFFIYFII